MYTDRSHEIIPHDLVRKGPSTIIDPSAMILQDIEIGDGCWIGPWVYIRGDKIKIGNNVWIGPGVKIHGEAGVVVEDNVGIGTDSIILTGMHDLDCGKQAISMNQVILKSVRLEAGCDIGVKSVILPGVTIGKGSQVGAASVVTQNIPPFEVWAGNPARSLRRRK